jgi:hypothetical protein
MDHHSAKLDNLIADLDDSVGMCVEGGNVGGFVLCFILGIIFPKEN